MGTYYINDDGTWSKSWVQYRKVKQGSVVTTESKVVTRTGGPECVVQFPHREYLYMDKKRADIGRIWAAALWAIQKRRGYKVGTKRTGWGAVAKEIGLYPKLNAWMLDKNALIMKMILEGDGYPKAGKRQSAVWKYWHPRSPGHSVVMHAAKGKLPEDQIICEKLCKLAGYQWPLPKDLL